MDIAQSLNALILGIVEGLTEFLPISSTGHLILFSQWFSFGDPDFSNTFNIVIQSGAILAVMLHFRRRLFPLFRGQSPEERGEIRFLWLKALVAFLPAVAVGLLASDFIDAQLMTPAVVAAALAAWGLVMIVIETLNARARASGKGPRIATVRDISIALALGIGCIQCLGMVPGTSRSAATIIGAMLLGCSRVAAAEFSFFLAIPTILGAGGYSLLKQLRAGLVLGPQEVLALALGSLVSFLVAWAVIAFLMRFIQKHDFRPFGWYRIALGLLIIALLAAGVPLTAS